MSEGDTTEATKTKECAYIKKTKTLKKVFFHFSFPPLCPLFPLFVFFFGFYFSFSLVSGSSQIFPLLFFFSFRALLPSYNIHFVFFFFTLCIFFFHTAFFQYIFLYDYLVCSLNAYSVSFFSSSITVKCH